MITFLVAKVPQAAHGMQLGCPLNNGSEEYSGAMGSLPYGLTNLFGKSVIGSLNVEMLGISRDG